MKRYIKWGLISFGMGVFIFSVLFIFRSGYDVALIEFFNRKPNPNLKFSFSRCGEKEFEVEKTEINQRWVESNVLEINTNISQNCGVVWLFGDYKVEESILYLYYSPIAKNFAACLCNFNVRYRISNLDKTNYTIKLLEENISSNNMNY